MSKLEDELVELKVRIETHEVKCDERWKTTFNRLDDIDVKLEKLDSRQIQVGGAIILFLLGTIVTILTTTT